MPVAGTWEQWQLAKSPIPLLGTVNNFGKALTATMLLPFPPYQNNYYQHGVFKGDLKAFKDWKDTMPALSVLNRWENFDQVRSFYIK